ncbi:MAG: DUF370 domain-containing protein [Thermacetogeniaceae bacterium]
MFLHIGGDNVVALEELVAIMDMETTKRETTREFLGFAADEKLVVHIGKREREKSIVITANRVYLSPISTATLLKRSLLQEEDAS